MFFFQKFWHIVEGDVSKLLKIFLVPIIATEIKYTLISLIPKSPGADSVDEFRPIILFNSLYKIITKVLTSRLLAILPFIISEQKKWFYPELEDSRIYYHCA